MPLRTLRWYLHDEWGMMRQRWKHSLLGLALVSATVAAPATANIAGAQGGTWQGFEAISVPTDVDGPLNSSPAFSASVSNELGGGGVDLWVNNHALSSETLSDFVGGSSVFSSIDRINEAGEGATDSHGGVFTDIDGDGDEDFIESAGRESANRVFVNNGGTLTLAGGNGMADPLARSRSVLNVDIDEDGDMDAVIATLDSRFFDSDGDEEPDIAPSAVYINDGNGNFTAAADPNGILFDENSPLEVGAQNLRYLHLTSTGPGTDQVIVTSNSFSFGVDTLRTGVSGVVAAVNPVTQSLGVDDNATQLRDIALGDVDGDLSPEWVEARQQDTLVDGDGNAIPEAMDLAIGVGQVTSPTGPEMLVDVSASALANNCRTVALADFDNDADLDIFGGCSMLANGQTTNIVLLNNGSGQFTVNSALVPATAAMGTATVSVVADFNDDGWMDTYVGGGYDAEPGEDFIFLNEQGNGNNWLKIDLVGSNPDAAGAQVFVGADDWQVRETGHRLHRGQDTGTLHFGLGAATAIAPVEIQWPDGTFESCTIAGGVNQTVTITQGAANCAPSNNAALQSTLAASPVLAGVEKCDGRTVTVDLNQGQSPTEGDDVILGTPNDDTINGLGGNDVICGRNGDDFINGGNGNDRILGEAGNDKLAGGGGNDTVIANNGNDELFGGTGNDFLDGGAGNDVLAGAAGNDIIAGGSGADRALGGADDDTINGGTGSDELLGLFGDDVINGGSEPDLISGGAGVDLVNGDAGNDEVAGGAGNDVVNGGDGDDAMNGGDGNDRVNGGNGSDILSGGTGVDVLSGGGGNDTMFGGDGNDTLAGGDGNDEGVGGNGDDTLNGGTGNDSLLGLGGLDRFDGGAGTDSCISNAAAEVRINCEP